MRLPGQQKRRQIFDAAAHLFATRPFHKVRLEDVAAAAHVGKGTLYIYASSKEDLYFALVYEGLEQLVQTLQTHLGHADPRRDLERIVNELVRFAEAHPQVFELLRAGLRPQAQNGGRNWEDKRRQLADLIEATLRRGVRQRILRDPNPALTAAFIPGLVRAGMLFGPAGLRGPALRRQIMRLLTGGLNIKGKD